MSRPPLVALCGPSGSGKTTLARHVIGLFSQSGLRVGALKQARDDFDVDHPGKDSYRLRKAGVERLLLGSERQSALIVEHPNRPPSLDELLALFDLERLDLILAEGYSDAKLPKIELLRAALPTGGRPRYPHDCWVIAVASDLAELNPGTGLPLLDIDDPWAVAEFIRRRVLID